MQAIFQEKLKNDNLIVNALNEEALNELISLRTLFNTIYHNLLEQSLKSQSKDFSKQIKILKNSLKKVKYYKFVIFEKESIFTTLELLDTIANNETVNKKAMDIIPKNIKESIEVLSFILKNILKSF